MYPRYSEFVALGGETHIGLGSPVRSIAYNQIKVYKNGTKIADSLVSIAGQLLTFPLASVNDVVGASYFTRINSLVADRIYGPGTTWDTGTANTNLAFSNGNLTVANQTGTNTQWHSFRAAAALAKGYWEIHLDNGGDILGVAPSSYPFSTNDQSIGNTATSVGWAMWSSSIQQNGSLVFSTPSTATGDVIGVAYEQSTGHVWFSKNGVWLNSGNPAAGTGYVATITAGTVCYPCGSCGGSTNNKPTYTARFALIDMTYTPPSGFSTFA